MLAVTGSSGRSKYQQGWSDLDVLLVADADRLTELRATLAELAVELRGVKLGPTVVSEAECRTGALAPRRAGVSGQALDYGEVAGRVEQVSGPGPSPVVGSEVRDRRLLGPAWSCGGGEPR
jgi:hypothetical protein